MIYIELAAYVLMLLIPAMLTALIIRDGRRYQRHDVNTEINKYVVSLVKEAHER